MIDQPLPILYSFRRCPYAMRARMAIHYCQQRVELREVELKNKPSSMVECSPKATVPVLVLDSQEVIDESLDIMFWSLENNDPDNWWKGLSQEQQQSILALIERNDNFFKHYLDRYKYADRYPEKSMSEYRAEAEVFIGQLEKRLNQNQFLLGDRITLADVAIFPFIRQFAFVDKPWFDQSQYKCIQVWLKQFLSVPLFTKVMEKYPIWNPEDKPVFFPT